jgi:hypothetical protein
MIKESRLFNKVLLENANQLNIEEYTKEYLNNLDYNEPGKVTSDLFWLGVFIANQFCRCNATESRKKLHEMNPRIYNEIVEDNRLERIENSVDLYEKAITYHKDNFSPKDAFRSLLDIGILRKSAIKALSNGIKFANSKKIDAEKEIIINTVKSLLDSINIDIDLYNTVLIWNENNRRLNIHANNPQGTQKARVLRPVELITENEIGF